MPSTSAVYGEAAYDDAVYNWVLLVRAVVGDIYSSVVEASRHASTLVGSRYTTIIAASRYVSTLVGSLHTTSITDSDTESS